MDLLKRLRDWQAWETTKANLKMACKETVDSWKEAEEKREADLLEPFDKEFIEEVKHQEATDLARAVSA